MLEVNKLAHNFFLKMRSLSDNGRQTGCQKPLYSQLGIYKSIQISLTPATILHL
jgi:hypothetical protein